jgi:hypothetical protein
MSNLFDFVLIMVSLVLAIGVTNLVQGCSELIRRRAHVRLQPIALIWAASLFLVAALYWWSLWDLRGAEWHFPDFFFMLLAPTLFHVGASLLVSTNSSERSSTFEAIRVPFMLTMAAFTTIVTWDGWVVGAEPAWTPYRPIQLWSIGLYLAGVVLDSNRAQYVIAWLVFVTYTVAGFFFRFLPGAFGT